MSKGKLIGIIVGVAIITCIIWSTMNKSNRDERIKSNLVQSTAKIISHDIPKSSGGGKYSVWIEYEYGVAGKTWAHKKKYHFKVDQENYFVGKTFPIIYNKIDPDDSRLLIIASEYEEFDLVQPDSLKKYNEIII